MGFDFGNFLFGFSIGLWVSYLLINIVGKIVYNRLMAQVEQEVAIAEETKRIEMKVEKHGDILYAFRKDNNDFVCQGVDFAELKRHFVQRFPGHNGTIVDAAKDLHEELTRQKNLLSADTDSKETLN